MHQMGFSKSHTAVDKQRVIGFRRVFCYSNSRRMGKPVCTADNECVECIFGIELDNPGLFDFRFLGFLDLRFCPDLTGHPSPCRCRQCGYNHGLITVDKHGFHLFHSNPKNQHIVFQFYRRQVAFYKRGIRHVIHLSMWIMICG